MYLFWYQNAHGSFYLNINWTDDNSKLNISKAKIIFLDKNKNLIAKGVISDGNNQYLQLIHPKFGNCYDIKNRQRITNKAKSWKECNNHILTWVPTWASKINYVTIEHKNCKIEELTSLSHTYKGSTFLLLYLYNPRGDIEMPYITYTSSIKLNSKICNRFGL